jgi:predicted DNA-binding transcriptional regulator YafY
MRNTPGKKPDFSTDGTVVRCLSLGLRIQQVGEYTAADAEREFGMPLRSYRRHLARLRSAGMILHSSLRHRRGVGYVRFVCFDMMFSVRSMTA